MRRLRIDLTLPGGGMAYMDRIRSIAKQELGWDEDRWTTEREQYEDLWKTTHLPPVRSGTPN